MSLKYKIIEKKMVAYATILISCKNKFTLKNFTKNPRKITGIVAIIMLRINGILSNIIPVYWGSDKVHDYINKDRFLNYHCFHYCPLGWLNCFGVNLHYLHCHQQY